jgi:glycerate kinase
MRILVAPQALKGSLDAWETGLAIARGLRAALPVAEIRVLPVADGGEGTAHALVASTGGQMVAERVTGPLGASVLAEYGLLGAPAGALGGRTAVIEMATAAGLPLVPLERRDPRLTTTRGVGELMRAALDAGCATLLIGIGGSATNDGGAGMAQALGVHLLDAEGAELSPGGAALATLARIDATDLDPRLRRARVLVACDVTNPLTGPEGASAIYGPQKGATLEVVRELDAALAHFAEIVRRDMGVEVAKVPGAGAAGGLGAGLLAFTGAELAPGATLVLDALGFDEALAGVDLLVTAEGQLDAQTAYGKAVGVVARRARKAGARVVALAGRVTLDAADLATLGLDVALPIADGPLTLEESMTRAPDLLAESAERALRLMLLGQQLTRE